jgi:hypothetical protein
VGRGSNRAKKWEHAPRQNGDPVPTRDTMCDLSRELFVVHKQEVDLFDVIDNEFFEAVGQEMPSLSSVPNTSYISEK